MILDRAFTLEPGEIKLNEWNTSYLFDFAEHSFVAGTCESVLSLVFVMGPDEPGQDLSDIYLLQAKPAFQWGGHCHQPVSNEVGFHYWQDAIATDQQYGHMWLESLKFSTALFVQDRQHTTTPQPTPHHLCRGGTA